MKNMVGYSVCVAVSLFAAKVAVADTCTVTASTGDLCAKETWKDGKMPASTDAVKFTSSWGGTFTLSDNMSVGSVQVDAGNLTFDFRSGKTLTLTTPVKVYGIDTLFHYPEAFSNPTWTKLAGGTWECQGKEFDIVTLGISSKSYTFIMTNGCHLSNVDRCYLFRRFYNGGRIYVTDQSKITAHELNFGDGNLGTNDIIEVSGGSTVTLSGSFVGQSSSEEFCSNWLVVKDQGTSLTCGSDCYLYLGHNGYGGFGVRVSDDAAVTADYVVFREGAENCHVEVLNGATIAPGCFDWYGSHCSTCVSNATLNVRWPRFSLGSSGGHHNRLTLFGPSTSFVNPMWDTDFMGSSSHHNVFEILGGATIALNRSVQLAKSTNNVIRIGGFDSKLALATGSGSNLFSLGETNAVGNVLEVVDGGTFEANGVWTYGTESQVLVSNGTLRVGGYVVGSSAYGLWLGRGSMASGCSLVLKGSTPKVELVVPNPSADIQPMIMQGNSVLRYEVPVEGYTEGYVPIEQQRLYPANGRLEIECAEWAAVKGEARTELVLFRGKTDLDSTVSEWIAQQDLNLPENVRCYVRGTDIILRRRGTQGMAITIR